MARKKQVHSKLYRILRMLFYRKRYILVICFLVLVSMIVGLVHVNREIKPIPTPTRRSWSQIVASDTLRAVTIASSFSAFNHNDQWYGHEYNNALLIADAMGLKLQVMLVGSEQAIVDSLFAGAADVAIWPMSYSVVSNHWFLLPTGPRWESSQCIVSARKLDLEQYADTLLTDSLLAELPHYKLSIIEESRQWLVLNHDSVRSLFDFRPFVVDTIPHDSLTNEQLTDSMIGGRTDAVMLRCNVARLMHDYYPALVISDTIPFSNDSVAWMLAWGSDTLQHVIDSLTAKLLDSGAPHYLMGPSNLRKQKMNHMRKAHHFKRSEGGISVYDEIFKATGKKYDIDWRLLAGIAYIESNFNHAIVSNRGPLGLMQLMPQTVEIYGYTNEEALDPEINVDVAAQLYARLRDLIKNRVPGISDEDLINFTLTAYNAGIGHLYDAIYLAEALGYKANVWSDHVEHCLRLKNEPKYYNMEVVKRGKFNGAFTINYVNEVTAAYQTFCEQMPLSEGKSSKSSKKGTK